MGHVKVILILACTLHFVGQTKLNCC